LSGEFATSVALVIPGRPKAEPGIQPFERSGRLDSGFALTRAPE
jgi:hypothetical protein